MDLLNSAQLAQLILKRAFQCILPLKHATVLYRASSPSYFTCSGFACGIVLSSAYAPIPLAGLGSALVKVPGAQHRAWHMNEGRGLKTGMQGERDGACLPAGAILSTEGGEDSLGYLEVAMLVCLLSGLKSSPSGPLLCNRVEHPVKWSCLGEKNIDHYQHPPCRFTSPALMQAQARSPAPIHFLLVNS